MFHAHPADGAIAQCREFPGGSRVLEWAPSSRSHGGADDFERDGESRRGGRRNRSIPGGEFARLLCEHGGAHYCSCGIDGSIALHRAGLPWCPDAAIP